MLVLFLVDPICRSCLCSPRIGLISVWFGPTNELKDPVACKVRFADARLDVPGIDAMLILWPILGLVFLYFSCVFGSITRRTFRSCGESSNYRRLDLHSSVTSKFPCYCKIRHDAWDNRLF